MDIGKHRARDPIVHDVHSANEAPADTFPHYPGFNTRLRTKSQSLSHDARDAGANGLVHQLADARGANTARVDDLIPIRREDRPDALKYRPLAAHHDLVNALRGTRPTASHG